DALGGVINVITEKPRNDAQLSFEAAYGNQRTPDASLFAAGRRGEWGASLAAEVFATDGYILVPEGERGEVDTPADSKHTTLDVLLERRLTKDARLFVRGNLFGEVRANGTPLQNNRTHVRQLSAGGDWNAPRFGAFLARAYGGTQVYDQDFSAVAADRDSEALTRSQRVPAQTLGFTLQWSRSLGARQAFVAGADAQEVRGASDERVFVGGRETSQVGAGGRERIFGIFAQDAVRVTSKLILTAGARYDRWRNYNAASATRPLTGSAGPTVTVFAPRTETAFSPRASLLYAFSDRLALNAAMYRAFRAPTLNELYRSFRVGDVLTLANQDLLAERLTGGEAGAKVTLGRDVNVRGVAFWSELTRPIANVTLRVAPGLITRQRQNLGRTRSRGLELELSAPFGERWSVSGGYALTDATVRSFPVNTDLEGLWLPQVPRHQLSVQTRYTNPRVVNFSLQGRAVGAQFDDDQNRFRLDSFFTLDAFASRSVAKGVELFAAVENVFNERYQVGRTPVTTLGAPLLARFGLRLRLGAK
ncbi:MAG TPA: TonB-dependent receptor, partial [Pyrinomonadaceae bacterium]|nr:TonB-dependent receptor [Pyrinomonadaceae bacterium]